MRASTVTAYPLRVHVGVAIVITEPPLGVLLDLIGANANDTEVSVFVQQQLDFGI
eukprot:m.758975 g.758975  ORF g.758975 m.758975 type:complete len:55 (-) comp23194_c0_seq9:545-709(-)